MRQPLLDVTKPQPPRVGSLVYPDVHFCIPQEQKTVYLTFDDGPQPIYTQQVLSILNTYSVPATFFMQGAHVDAYPDEYMAVQEAGHRVGSHTYDHLNALHTPRTRYFENVEQAAERVHSNLFRPPYGKLWPFQAHQLSKTYTIVIWDILTMDYDHAYTGEDCFRIVKEYVRNGSIIVFHDSQKAEKNLRYALPATIEYLLRENYTFAPIAL